MSPDRSLFSAPRFFFSSSRRRFAAGPGRVGMRLRGLRAALRIASHSRSRASPRFFAWLRWFCALMTSTPSVVMRLSWLSSNRRLTRSGSEEAAMSNRRWIAVATLLTF